ncbi:MAG: DUF6011 domain-containing protein [Patescibacteria group bacterium]|jgi:hypothetical protein|nr:DUF6011 domain-containing protein [Methanoregulaceae archaeon]
MTPSLYCLKCNRPLSNPKSIRHGYGPECWSKVQRTLRLEDNQAPEKVTISDQKRARDTRVRLRKVLHYSSRRKNCDCGTPFSECELMTCDHEEGGVPLDGYAVPQWIWYECPKCGYQTAWWKVLHPYASLKSLAPRDPPPRLSSGE